MSGWVRVAAATDIADERTLRVEIDGVAVCLARSGGELFAVNDTCTHADVSLSEGEVENCQVECWLHGSQFNLRTGEPNGLPAVIPIATYAVETTKGEVYVDINRRPNHYIDNTRGAHAASAREN
jgi:3-phenylpropionate/trans-cinnamate dioxygenase ferredoxin subunit